MSSLAIFSFSSIVACYYCYKHAIRIRVYLTVSPHPRVSHHLPLSLHAHKTMSPWNNRTMISAARTVCAQYLPLAVWAVLTAYARAFGTCAAFGADLRSAFRTIETAYGKAAD